jgi:DNA-binding NarL/FixJ family response regulator
MGVMSASALILTRDKHVFDTLLPILQAAELKVEGSFSPGEGLKNLAKKKFDAVLIDMTSVPDSQDILEALRQGKSNRRAVAFAITEDPDETQKAFKAGANFVLEKPISSERAVRSVRAALGLILRERRRYFRYGINSALTLQHGENSEVQLAVENVSEGGVAAIVPESCTAIHSNTSVRISFRLPQSTQLIAGKADVVWQRSGKIGLQFAMLRPESRTELTQFLSRKFDEVERAKAGKRAAFTR